MDLTFDQLIDYALRNTSDVLNTDAIEYAQIGMAFALIAIAKELHEMNERENYQVHGDYSEPDSPGKIWIDN